MDTPVYVLKIFYTINSYSDSASTQIGSYWTKLNKSVANMKDTPVQQINLMKVI